MRWMTSTACGSTLYVLLGTASLGGCGATEEAGPVATDVETVRSNVGEVRYVGRFDWSEPNAPRGGWSGLSACAHFDGSAVSAELDDSGQNVFAVILDGAVQPAKLQTAAGRRVYDLASGLAAAPHEVCLWRLTEALEGETQFYGFLCAGQFLPPPPEPRRRIEVIGESITCGYGVDGPDQYCPFSAETENHYRTYAAVAAREVGADLFTLAWSGKGVFNNRGDRNEPMPELYLRTLPTRSASRWDFTTWTPQAVVINLCTNDFGDGVPDRAAFVDAYLDLVRLVRRNYPSALILCTLGPMLSDDWPVGERQLTTARDYIGEVVASMTKAGDERVAFLEFAPQDGSTGYGCDWHPSAETQARMGAQLAAALRARLGW